MAAAAAVRSGGAACGMARLPNVPQSNGDVPVSPMATVTAPGGTASSSATSRPSAVLVPWPASTLPVNAVTVPSAPTCTHASSVSRESSPGSPGPATTVISPSGMAAVSSPGLAPRSQGRPGTMPGSPARSGRASPAAGTGSSSSGCSISSAARCTARRIRG